MKTLYVSDLDGTLLKSNEKTSDFTNRTINELTAQGMLFSYATARSYVTAQKTAQGLQAQIPVIIYNGAFIRDSVSGKILLSSYFEDDPEGLLRELMKADVYPLVYAMIPADGMFGMERGKGQKSGGSDAQSDKIGVEKFSGEFREKFSYMPQHASAGMHHFLDERRKGDPRERAVFAEEALLEGRIFYITCIDEYDKLKPLYERYRKRYYCVLSQEIYTKDWFLEIMPLTTSKARAVTRLKEYLGCDRVVAFGDHYNDIDLFEIADEAYAVANAVDELKAVATGVIASNDEDGVAHFLRERYQQLNFLER
ncbi:MAG: HAD family hydrolase [bacterium]|nr:HAD family hydrolase [bacterium]